MSRCVCDEGIYCEACHEALIEEQRGSALVCDSCEILIVDDPHALIEDPWGQSTGAVYCENCRIASSERAAEDALSDEPSDAGYRRDMINAGRGHLVRS